MLGKVIIENGQKKIQALTADTGVGAPVGSYLYLEKKSNPQGYLYCDGSTFDETAYPALYQYLGTNVLPDWRELGAKGAEKNTTLIFDSTETDPSTGQAGTQNHDVFTQGEFKDDQIQEHKHGVGNTSSGQLQTNFNSSTGGYGGISYTNTENNNNNRLFTVAQYDDRHGNVTRGKSRAVFIYIKATSGLTENQQENVLNTINENNSYFTEEHPTGAKWIDGKPIYTKTVYVATTSANPIDISSLNIDTPIRVANAVSLKYNNATEKQVLPQLAGGIGGGISFQQNYLVVTKGIASYDYQDNYITLEYTKTTD